MVNNKLSPTNILFLEPEEKVQYQNFKAGLEETKRIMNRIETNTIRPTNLEVATDASLVASGYTEYDIANGGIKIHISPKPIQVVNPTPQQEEDFDDKLNMYYGNIAHELKHVEQYLDGKISFDKTTGHQGVLHDAIDEKEAYDLYFLMIGQRNTEYDTATKIKTISIYSGLSEFNHNVWVTPASTLINDFYIR